MSKEEPLFAALGSRIRGLRKQRGLTQISFGVASGLHRTYVADIERGARNLSLANVSKIATALEISIAQLFDGIDQRYLINLETHPQGVDRQPPLKAPQSSDR